MCAELLPPLPAGSADGTAHRHLDLPSRFSMHRPQKARGISVVGNVVNTKTRKGKVEMGSRGGIVRAPERSESMNPDRDVMTFELSSRRTGLSFQRTRMSADRTLMSVIRTSLSLIGFGFTIFTFFRSLRDTVWGTQTIPTHAPRNFGLALVILGVGLLVLGIWYHIHFMRELRAERHQMIEQGLVHGQLPYPISMTLIGATLLLFIGLVAIFSMVTRAGPFH